MIALLVASALAVTPGGFRIDGAVPVRSLAVRPVFVLTPNEPSVFETMLAARFASGSVVGGVSLPVVATGGAGLSDTGVGQLRAGVGWQFGVEDRPASIGFEVALSPAPSWARVSAWGTIARDALPGAEGLVVYQASWNPSAPWSFRLAGGVLMGDSWSRGLLAILPAAEIGLAHAQPLNDDVAVVVEGELMVDRTPATARVLLRAGDADGAFDLGLQLPFLAWAEGRATLQIVSQARWFF